MGFFPGPAGVKVWCVGYVAGHEMICASSCCATSGTFVMSVKMPVWGQIV